ncbi:MAG: hypothetical protein R8G66_24080 [Cytophagales bacterium]|nr:hypothetical protein [Cytophagales bacterium]
MKYIGYLLILSAVVFSCGGTLDEQRIISHYQDHEREFDQLISFFTALNNADRVQYLLFEDEYITLRVRDETLKEIKYQIESKVITNLNLADALRDLNWSESDLLEVKNRLDKVNCKSLALLQAPNIENSVEVGYTDFGLISGIYYRIDPKPISENMKFSMKENSKIISDNVLWYLK